MNLNSYLPLPTAPRATSSPASGPLPGPASGTDTLAGQSMGLDFAQIMARQLQQLPATQRQNFAATSDAIQADTAQQAALAAERETHSNEDRVDTRSSQRALSDTPLDSKNDKQASHPKTGTASANPRNHKSPPHEDATDKSPTDGNAPLVSTPLLVPPDAALRATASAATERTVDTSAAQTASHKLQMFVLSPKVNIITDPRQAPSPESLTAFAKSMGLDDATIQSLMGTSAPADAKANGLSGATTPLAGGVAASANTAPNNAGFNISALLGAALSGGADNLPTTPTDTLAAHPPLAQASITATAGASANLLLSSATAAMGFGIDGLPANGMRQADMAAIQQIQMTVLPAAVLPVQGANTTAASMPSTASVLSLLGGKLQEPDIAALASSFSPDGEAQSNASDSEQSGQSPTQGFAQTLAPNNVTNNRSTAIQETTNHTPMSEVYDQLSDKLATEMAARMHKQLSDGQWKMKFGLRPAHLGGVEIQLEMKDGKLDAVFRADNPLTRDLLQNSTQKLREALQNFGIHAGFVQVGHNGGQSQHNASGNSTPQAQVRDNSSLGSNSSDTASPVVANRGQDSTSLLDLYA